MNTQDGSPLGWTGWISLQSKERIRKVLIGWINLEPSTSFNDTFGFSKEQILAWLEKKSNTNETINRDEFAQGVLRGAAINLITWIDYNVAEGNMCLSNMECKDIEDSLVSGNWDKIYAYIKKKLDKEGEQAHADMAEPKFKVGEWIYHEISGNTFHINRMGNRTYISDEGATISFGRQNNWKLWTIQDAKDGDVLQLYNVTVIFKEYIGNGNCKCHCSIYNGEFEIPSQNGEDNSYGCHIATPATKEQRELLFQKMKEVGYKLDKDFNLVKI